MTSNQRSKKTYLDYLAQWSSIIAAVLIPVFLGIITYSSQHEGQIITQRQNDQNVTLEYVKIAKDILSAEQISNDTLKNWSWRLLNEQAPTKLTAAELENLKNNRTSLPSPIQSELANPQATSSMSGFILIVLRETVELRGSKRRTVGRYFALYKGERIPGIEGYTYESPGPSNDRPGSGKRIRSGVYPLATTSGMRYDTFEFGGDNKFGGKKRPGILIADTRERVAILIHPGKGFLSAIGTINLSGKLKGPEDDIVFDDSLARVTQLIKAMKEKLGSDFPKEGFQKIPEAWLVLAGEPADPVTQTIIDGSEEE